MRRRRKRGKRKSKKEVKEEAWKERETGEHRRKRVRCRGGGC